MFAVIAADTPSPIENRVLEIVASDISLEKISEKLYIPLEILRASLNLNEKDSSNDKKTLYEFEVEWTRVIDLYYEYHELYPSTTLEEACKKLQIPYKKIAVYLNVDPRNKEFRTKPLSFFQKETLDILDLREKFNEDMLDYSSIMIILAMIMTFIALLIIAFALARMAALGKKMNKKQTIEVSTPIGQVVLEDNDCLNSDVVVAVVAAIERYRATKMKDSQIMLTWRRTNVSWWRLSSKLQMPNVRYHNFRKY